MWGAGMRVGPVETKEKFFTVDMYIDMFQLLVLFLCVYKK